MPAVMESEKVVKCACGLPMRQKNWLDHWRTCYKAGVVPVTNNDVKNLEASEDRQRQAAIDHETWFNHRRDGK